MKTALESGFSGWPAPPRPPAFRIPKPFLIEFITAFRIRCPQKRLRRAQAREGSKTSPTGRYSGIAALYLRHSRRRPGSSWCALSLGEAQAASTPPKEHLGGRGLRRRALREVVSRRRRLGSGGGRA